jgi:sulfotransferase
MIKKVFYNASFPRAGSTLIQNVLAQNPEIYTSPTSGLFRLLNQSKQPFLETAEFVAQDKEEVESGFKGFLKGGIEGYYNNITSKPYIIDKNRRWLGEYNFVNFYDPNPKIFCFVRDLRSVFASLEKRYRTNPHKFSPLINWDYMVGTTTHKRVIELMNHVVVTSSIDSLNQALLEGFFNNILFIKYEDFCLSPNKELKKLYDYLELPYYQHDLNQIQQITQENDEILGVLGEHTIRPILKLPKEDYLEVLGQETCDMIVEKYKWFYDFFHYNI